MTIAEKKRKLLRYIHDAIELNKQIEACLYGPDNNDDMKTMKENVTEAIAVIDAVKEKVIEAGIDVSEEIASVLADKIGDLYDAGKKAEYDAFWDGFQDYGNRKDYNQGFKNWISAKTISPKYPIITQNISELFRNCEKLETAPQVISTNADGTFGMCNMGYYQCYNLKSIDYDIYVSGTSSSSWNSSFNSCKSLKRIKKIGVLESHTFTRVFENCIELEEIAIDGTIGQNGFDIHWSTKLTHDSLMSIINALADKSGTGTTWTITLGTENLAKLTDGEKAIATQKGWTLA